MILHIGAYEGSIDTNMLGELCCTGSCTILIAPVLSDNRGVGVVIETKKILKQPSYAFVVKRAIVCNSAFALEGKSAICFFIF